MPITKEVAVLLGAIYVPLMWVLAAASGCVGLVALWSPGSFRGVIAAFTKNRPVRVLGVVLVVIGAELFVRSKGMAVDLRWVTKALGAFLFVDGGVFLLIPTVVVILAEWLETRSEQFYRVLGLFLIVAAYLLYLAAQLSLTYEPPIPTAPRQHYR